MSRGSGRYRALSGSGQLRGRHNNEHKQRKKGTGNSDMVRTGKNWITGYGLNDGIGLYQKEQDIRGRSVERLNETSLIRWISG